MALPTVNIEQRTPVWIKLSELYLDTELEDSNLSQIASVMLASPYSFKEIKTINKYEVFPVLQINLLSVAGVWMGFDEEWLVRTIAASIKKRRFLQILVIESTYLVFRWMQRNYWQRLENIYNEIKKNTDFAAN